MPVSLYPEDMMLQRGVLVLGMHPIMFYGRGKTMQFPFWAKSVVAKKGSRWFVSKNMVKIKVIELAEGPLTMPHSPVPLEVWEGMTRVQVELPLPLPLLYLWVYFWRYTLTPGDPYRRLLVRKIVAALCNPIYVDWNPAGQGPKYYLGSHFMGCRSKLYLIGATPWDPGRNNIPSVVGSALHSWVHNIILVHTSTPWDPGQNNIPSVVGPTLHSRVQNVIPPQPGIPVGIIFYRCFPAAAAWDPSRNNISLVVGSALHSGVHNIILVHTSTPWDPGQNNIPSVVGPTLHSRVQNIILVSTFNGLDPESSAA
ncbi:hypothetical protein DFH09DRAFT_1101669 [Mycena vulgaris]|nr:hypothetical protein DFH09DRAFT_1101669 [Mycena vulgaris]